MKKLALVLAIVLVACMLVVGCQKVGDETSSSNAGNNATSSVAGGNNDGSSEVPASSEAPASSQTPTTPNTPSAGAVWQDFSALANAQGKGTEFTGTEGIFTITRGKATTSSGKTVKEGSKAETSFTGGIQLGKNGSATDKCISFTVPAGCTTVEIYANCGSTGVTAGGYTAQVNGTANALSCPNANIVCNTVAVSGGQTVILFGGADGSINIWGIYIY